MVFIPNFYNLVLINFCQLNSSFNVSELKTMVIYYTYLWLKFYLGIIISFDNMHMDRRMVLREEEESQSEYLKYCRHIFLY